MPRMKTAIQRVSESNVCVQSRQQDMYTKSSFNILAPTFDADRLCSIWPEVREVEGGYELVHELLQDQHHMIQANVHAKTEPTDHTVVWRWTDDIDGDSPEAEELLVANGRGKYTGNGDFVRNLVLGDVVSVWGRARFGAWRNLVESVQIEVYWAV